MHPSSAEALVKGNGVLYERRIAYILVGACSSNLYGNPLVAEAGLVQGATEDEPLAGVFAVEVDGR